MKKAMTLLGVTLVSGLILTTAQEVKAQETSENIIALRSRRSGSRSSSRGSRSGSKFGFGSSKGHHSDGNSGKGYKSDSGSSKSYKSSSDHDSYNGSSKLMVLVARIVRIQTLILVPNQVAVRAIQTVSPLLVTVLASQNRIQIQDTQSLRCHLLS